MQTSRQRREQVVAGVLAFTQGTPMEAGPYERHLLAEYVRGHLTLEQVERLVANALAERDKPAPSPRPQP